MMCEWQTLSLENAPLEIIDGDRGTNYPSQAEFSACGHCLFLNTGNVTTSGFNFSYCAFITDEKDDLLRKGKLVRNDVVLTTRGTIGNSAYFDNSIPFDHIRINSGMVILRAKQTVLHSRYLYFFIRSALFHSQVEALRSGSAQPQLPIRDINRIEIPIPPFDVQRAIAHILGTLDDKIELNRRMNETLEAMARALFKSWFVDFDPVHAKAEGRDTGLPKHIADLFPDSFEDSELGEIPKGWEVSTLGELIETVKGRSYKSEELVESDTALVTLKSFARGGGYRPDGLKSFTGTYKPEQVVSPGELVIACTDVTQAAEVIGRPIIVRANPMFRTLVASLDTMIVRPIHKSISRAFIYFLAGTQEFIDHTYAHTTGTTVLHLAKEAVPSFMFPCPVAELVEVFNDVAGLIIDRVQTSEQESNILSVLRDMLLPKLISGKLRLKNINEIMESK
jgi:type I restriction enzyme S subunit